MWYSHVGSKKYRRGRFSYGYNVEDLMQRASGDVPGGQAQLCNDPPGSTSSIADAELCPRTPCEPERSELSVVCTD